MSLPDTGVYDDFLITVGFAFRALIVWYAQTWPAPARRQAGESA